MTVTAGLPRPPQPTPANRFPDSPLLPPKSSTYIYCPHCGTQLGGMLAGCSNPGCLTTELDYDARFVRAEDI